MAGNTLVKEVEKAGMSITKEKLIEAIKKLNQKEFMFSQSQGSKTAVVVISL